MRPDDRRNGWAYLCRSSRLMAWTSPLFTAHGLSSSGPTSMWLGVATVGPMLSPSRSALMRAPQPSPWLLVVRRNLLERKPLAADDLFSLEDGGRHLGAASLAMR